MNNAQVARDEWEKIAKKVGFETEAAMWHQLYTMEGRSVAELAKVLGYGTATVARRLSVCEVTKRPRGGAHNPSQVAVLLGHLDQRVVRLSSVAELAKMLGVSSHSIYRVKKEM